MPLTVPPPLASRSMPVSRIFRPVSARPRLALPSARLRRALAAVLLGLVGGWLGLALGGTVHHEVGPLATSMRVAPTWGGGTTVAIPPLGELVLDTHDGPLGLRARLVGVDVEEARALLAEPERLSSLPERAAQDLRWEVLMAAGRSLLAAVVGAAALALLALRRVSSTLLAAGSGAVAVLAAAAVAVATWNPAALSEPRYTGLLTSAPSVIGDASRIVDDFSMYGDQLARLVENVTGLYAVSSDLPLLPTDRDVVRVLHVSDLHLAPHAWDVMHSVTRNYEVDVIVDTGDITDHGSRAENRYVREIRHFPVPYVWVRGNHDSLITERAMRRLPNAVVLDDEVRRVAGLTFAGAGDPTFTPDKSTPLDEEDRAALVAGAADDLAQTITAAGGVDVAVYHDPAPTEVFDGLASVVLSGHWHRRLVELTDEGTWLMTQGSTGGSGLRALEPAEPADIELSVLYLDRTSGELLAYDDISLGGLGLASAQIDRRVVASPDTQMVAPSQPDSSGDEEPSGLSEEPEPGTGPD